MGLGRLIQGELVQPWSSMPFSSEPIWSRAIIVLQNFIQDHKIVHHTYMNPFSPSVSAFRLNDPKNYMFMRSNSSYFYELIHRINMKTLVAMSNWNERS